MNSVGLPLENGSGKSSMTLKAAGSDGPVKGDLVRVAGTVTPLIGASKKSYRKLQQHLSGPSSIGLPLGARANGNIETLTFCFGTIDIGYLKKTGWPLFHGYRSPIIKDEGIFSGIKTAHDILGRGDLGSMKMSRIDMGSINIFVAVGTGCRSGKLVEGGRL